MTEKSNVVPFLSQEQRAQRCLSLFEEKLRSRGFVIEGDTLRPPVGMGGFAVTEIMQKAWVESLAETRTG